MHFCIYLFPDLLAGLNKFQGRLDLVQFRGDKILVVIQIGIGICDRIELFLNIMRQDIALKIDIA